ncbi:MAG: universal stress protein [Planctomycetes bacterium]|nr:universal stress protein [Planctomycetota bacterium]
MKKILIPLDGSELAESVLSQVRPLLAREEAEILLLRVVTMPPSVESDAGEPLDLLWSRAVDYLQNLSARLSGEGLRVRTRAVEGIPADEILEAARKEGADLIAMSTHGRTGLARWVFGSVTEKILRASPVPVLAIPSFTGAGGDVFPTGARQLPFGKIIAPIAATDLSLEILPPLAEFARLFGSKVFLVHVCEGTACAVPIHEMRLAHERLGKAGVPAEPLLKQGDPASRILEACRDQGADLIAMTTHGRSGLTRWMLGSVAEKVLRASNVPLLVVRPAKKARGARSKAAAASPAP